MPHTVGSEGYAVVSCHVERPLDDDVWRRYLALIASRPGGFPIASLLRPPDAEAGEREEPWLERARAAAEHGPLGHHTHWTSPTHARPTGGDPAARVEAEGRRLREAGVEPRFFCGGGWYMDEQVAAAVAGLGYVDCTATSFRPSYLAAGAPRLALDGPARLLLADGRLLTEVPTTHSLGMAARALVARGGLGGRLVHVHFHDYELLDRRRAAALRVVLAVLARRRRAVDVAVVAEEAARAEPRPFAAVAEGAAPVGAAGAAAR